MLNGYHNTNGSHGNELVAYIYGELDETSRNAFELHLAGCDECAIELAAMSDARLGVVEWRRTDFEHLATPEIVIPVDRPVVGNASKPRRTPLFAGLVESLLSSPLFGRAGIGLAAAALLIGVIYFAGQRSVTREIAKKPENTVAPQSAPNETIDAPKETSTATTGDVAKAPMTVDPESKNKERRLAATHVVTNQTVVKSARKSNTVPPKSQVAQKRAPRLNSFEEEEDKTLRLSDLFAEIGPGRK